MVARFFCVKSPKAVHRRLEVIMKVARAGLLSLATLLVFTVMASAAPPTVLMTHNLIGSSEGDKTVTLSFTVHVKNTGDSPISNLTLSFVPRPPFMPGNAILKIDSLGPHQRTDLPLQLTMPALVNAEEHHSKRRLFFAGKCLDSQGQQIEFPVTSHFRLQGGVK
jgi:hypothetical protein